MLDIKRIRKDKEEVLKALEKRHGNFPFGFKIKTVQTNNRKDFCNNPGQTESAFERVLRYLGIEYIRTRPYSPWQNGVVEHRRPIRLPR